MSNKLIPSLPSENIPTYTLTIKYDIESFNNRCIEVKSFRTTDSPSITSHEWETARKMEDDYWLYIVENALDNPKVNPIQDPYEKAKDSIRTEEETVKRYYIDNWKEVL